MLINCLLSRNVMRIFRQIVLFLLFWPAQSRESTDQYEVVHEFRFSYVYPIDFRCSRYAFKMFEFTNDYYPKIKYVDKPRDDKPQGRCYAFDNPFILYPALTALDLMMVAQTFEEYFERFQSDSETCRKLKEITLECYTFRQMRKFWAQDAYDKLCLDEDGCFNIMELYGDDLPYCVKYIASEQFKNASFGSWHHSFINYCELTDIVPEVKYANYDRLIVKESGRVQEQLKLMCEYLRFQVFAEEEKEGEIQQVERGKEERSSCARFYWNLIYLLQYLYHPDPEIERTEKLQSHTLAQDSTDQYELMHEIVPDIDNPVDFRCTPYVLSRLEFTEEHYPKLTYIVTSLGDERKGACYAFRNPQVYYPTITAFDPMMSFYIQLIYKGLAIFAKPNELYDGAPPPLSRRQYCIDIRLIGSTFAEYFERFNSDGETCWKLKEITVECYNFRHMRQFWVQGVYNKLCLDEDGCFNIMDFYGDDVPYCVKYIAIEELKNASLGSWHHSFINYCELTDLIPEAKYANYDRLIVRESGKTEEQMKLMCEYFRYQLLTEEGQDGEIRDVKSVKEERSTCARFYWNLLYILIIACYLW